MNFKTKIWILVALFATKGALHLLDGIGVLSSQGSYGEYGDAFVSAAIFAFLAYAVYASRNKWTYWVSVFFTGLVLFRFVTAFGLISYSRSNVPAELVVLGILNGLLFGLIPLIILLPKSFRTLFLI